jgi:hypothetical protein
MADHLSREALADKARMMGVFPSLTYASIRSPTG